MIDVHENRKDYLITRPGQAWSNLLLKIIWEAAKYVDLRKNDDKCFTKARLKNLPTKKPCQESRK